MRKGEATFARSSVRFRRGLSGHFGFRRVSVGTLIWHDRTRRGLTDRSTVTYRFTIDVRTPWARHGSPTGCLGPRRDPTDPRRTPSGTVGPRLIGASPVWAARSSYWRSQGYCTSLLGKTSGACPFDIVLLKKVLQMAPAHFGSCAQGGWPPAPSTHWRSGGKGGEG